MLIHSKKAYTWYKNYSLYTAEIDYRSNTILFYVNNKVVCKMINLTTNKVKEIEAQIKKGDFNAP